MFETVVAVLLLIPKLARSGAGLSVVWMIGVILSHIFVLGYGFAKQHGYEIGLNGLLLSI